MPISIHYFGWCDEHNSVEPVRKLINWKHWQRRERDMLIQQCQLSSAWLCGWALRPPPHKRQIPVVQPVSPNHQWAVKTSEALKAMDLFVARYIPMISMLLTSSELISDLMTMYVLRAFASSMEEALIPIYSSVTFREHMGASNLFVNKLLS